MATPTDPAPGPRFPGIRLRMTGRAPAEENRVSSPLELLFDLTFVVAIAQVASQLAQHIARGEALAGVGPYLMVFFAVWWAWMNFTWFASAYDTDDVPYRLLTLVQMGGVLVLAAGVDRGGVAAQAGDRGRARAADRRGEGGVGGGGGGPLTPG